MQTTKQIRTAFIDMYNSHDFVLDRTGAKVVEIIGATFIANEPWIIRQPNYEYADREIQWYESTSLNVNDIPGETPAIWKSVSSKDGFINSNYGWCIWSPDNGNQYEHTLAELKRNPDSRRATMIYNRPSMHTDYCKNGMTDFMCTFGNQFFIRNNKLVSHYIMRSNDAVFGYNNDYHWAKHVQQKLHRDLLDTYPTLEIGDIIWTASTLHVYERHFKFITELPA